MLGERIRIFRQKAMLSQEKVAELVGVSRQAVTKWESGQSAPCTQHLLKLAEIFHVSVEELIKESENTSTAEQLLQLLANEKEQLQKQRTRNILFTLLGILVYLVIYVICRMIWCYDPNGNVMGWLVYSRVSGEHSYLFGWLLSSHLYWYALVISVLPCLWGKRYYTSSTIVGFVLGLISGIIFGPYPEGIPYGHGHYGWAIWGGVFLLSIVVGILYERYKNQ
ncbi:MAG: helix-turn-helix domain-containing protein [Erysipelotrichales bacterium]|nr:helix-turn-helix domain-containing protein [Erysipelotrichales bacterium]MBR3693128.1 helix-turn-helix domain-containing protein [Erysipelotrichales bacterium]